MEKHVHYFDHLRLISGALLLAVISVGTYRLTEQNGAFDQTFQTQARGFEVLLAMIVFLFFKQNFHRETRLYRAVPVLPLALPIYFMHGILLSMMMHFMPAHFPVTTFFGTMWITILNLLICYLVTKTVATIKPLCYLATGMSYDAACRSCNWIYTYRKCLRRQ